MQKPAFDRYAKQYDLLLSQSLPKGFSENGYFAEYKIALAAKLLNENKPHRILDFGCGSGRSLIYIEKYFPGADLWGYDVSPLSIEVASERMPLAKLYSDWNTIRGTKFDLIIAANVFHHIPLAKRFPIMSQCYDSLNQEGQMLLFEHNPYNPVTRWVFKRCPFDADAKMIDLKTLINLAVKAGFRPIQHGYTLFFPRPLSFLRRIETWLKRFPFGAQYYVQIGK